MNKTKVTVFTKEQVKVKLLNPYPLLQTPINYNTMFRCCRSESCDAAAVESDRPHHANREKTFNGSQFWPVLSAGVGNNPD